MTEFVLGFAAMAFASVALGSHTPQKALAFRTIEGLAGFEQHSGESPGSFAYLSPVIEPGMTWDELVVSWSIDAPKGAHARIEACGVYPDRTTRFYTLAYWSADDSAAPRHSVKGQEDDDGDVKTDTLVLKKPGAGVRLRVTLVPNRSGELPEVRHLDLCFFNTAAQRRSIEPLRSVWGRTIEVPRRSQMSYPNGNVLCSPTVVSMILKHWSETLSRPELDRDVPEVQRGVYDRVWRGTGNWPFNTAFAAQLPGFRSYVTRFRGIEDLEAWIDRGVPVATSVSYSLLKGKPEKTDNDGHLVVLVGFTSSGDPVFNDPGRGTEVRQVYQRPNFLKAWETSHNTVYLIYPSTWAVPNHPDAPWDLGSR